MKPSGARLITYVFVLNLAATLAALTLVLAEAPIALVAIIPFPAPALLPLCGHRRLAQRRPLSGNPFHAAAAKLVLVVWIGFWLVF